jgi:multicomponent Na+:H+ antiporter subunit B
VAIARLRDLFGAAMLFGIYSLLSAGVFVILDAPDVAFTEAAVGAGISTVLMLATLALTARSERPSARPQWLPLLVVAVTGAALIYGTLDMPRFGDPDAPVHRHVAPHYLQQGPIETGVPNVVTAVLASYRGYDTLGEVTVIFTAGLGVLTLLGLGRAGGASPASSAADRAMAHHVILRVVSKLLLPLILLFALYVQFHGDYGPGGGFQAGVIFAAGFILYALVFGVGTASRVATPGALRNLVALGVLVFGGVGVATMLLGGDFLDYNALAADPVAGQHLGILLVEAGVGITVAAVMTTVFFAYAGRD